MKKSISLLLALLMMLMLLGACGEGASVKDPVPKDFQGLVLIAPAGTTVILYSGFVDGQVIPADEIYQTDQGDYHCYRGLSGAYRCTCAGNGYYSVKQNIFLTQEDAQGRKDVQILNGKRTNKGWEPDSVDVHTEQLRQSALTSEESQIAPYLPAFQSPYFTQEHGLHQATTQEEMMAFLRELDGSDDSLYLFNSGYSGGFHHEIPLAVFTKSDLSAATNLEEAARLLDQDKPTVLFRGQMHGNEPAGGEAALALIYWLDSTLGESYLDHMNICVIPRQNPDGAQNYQRTTTTRVDTNWDNLRLETPEAEAYAAVCRLFRPEVIVDAHEWNNHSEDMVLNADVCVGVGFTPDNSEAFCRISLDIHERIWEYEAAAGQSCRYLTNTVNKASPMTARNYASLQGTIFFLLETRGIGMGLTAYENRIVGHLAGIKAVLDHVAEDPTGIKAAVNAERTRIAQTGGVYTEENQVYLDLVVSDAPEMQYEMTNYSQDTGEARVEQVIPEVYMTAQRQRIAPTAYVIPAGESYAEPILSLMEKHGIAYTFLPAGSTVNLQQYDSKEEDYLTDEQAVTFENGAYVFCRNQVGGKILSVLMEPDVDDLADSKSTLIQRGMLKGENGVYPLYRYIHDLNSDGFIDYQ